jgi:methyl-accepting chemotaxis protein
MFSTIKARLYLAIGLFVLIAAVQVALLWLQAAATMENDQRIVEVLEPTQVALHQLEVNVIQIQQWFTDISATRGLDGLDDGQTKAADNYAAARRHLDNLKTLHPQWQSALQKVGRNLDAYYRAGEKMAQAYIDGGPQGGNPMMGQFDTTAERIAGDIRRLQDKVDQYQTDILTVQMRNAERSSTLVVVFMALYVAMALGLLLLVRVVVLNPLSFFHHTVSSLNAGNANLAARFKVQGDDEIGRIQTEFNTLLDTLEKTYSDIGKHAQALSGSVKVLNRTITATETGVLEQQSQLELVSTAITEMAQTSQEVARNTEVAAGETARMAEQVRTGSQITAQTAQSFRQIAQKISASADTVTQLEQDTAKIQSVLEVIRGIAEQTNLLALNAAIEAARAGEQGRGFAVVADEVRSLAGRTQESTKEIRSIIESLQTASANAVTVMRASMLDIDHCVDESGRSKLTMEDIGRAMDVVNHLILQIATAMEEQTAVANDVSRSVVAVRDIALETSGHAGETGRQTAVLAQQTVDLQKLAGALGA